MIIKEASMPSHDINNQDTLPEIRTRSDLQGYFEKYYGQITRAYSHSQAVKAAIGGGMSLSEAAASTQIRQGNEYFKEQNYTKALKHYIKALRSPDFYYETIYKIALCLKNGADINETVLTKSDAYKRSKGDTSLELAAVFFREVIALDPSFDYKTYPLLPNPDLKNPHFTLAIYSLGVCIAEGALVNAQDLIGTSYEGHIPEEINPQYVEKVLYQQAWVISRQDPKEFTLTAKFQDKMATLLEVDLSQSWIMTPQDKENLRQRTSGKQDTVKYERRFPICGITDEAEVARRLNLLSLANPSDKRPPAILHSPHRPSTLIISSDNESFSPASPGTPYPRRELLDQISNADSPPKIFGTDETEVRRILRLPLLTSRPPTEVDLSKLAPQTPSSTLSPCVRKTP